MDINTKIKDLAKIANVENEYAFLDSVSDILKDLTNKINSIEKSQKQTKAKMQDSIKKQVSKALNSEIEKMNQRRAAAALEMFGYRILEKHKQDSNKIMDSANELYKFANDNTIDLSKDERKALNDLYLQKVGNDLSKSNANNEFFYKGKFWNASDYFRMKENERLQRIKEAENKRIQGIADFAKNYERLQKEKEYEAFKKRFS